MQKILHEEQNNSAEEGWSFVKRTESCEIWRKNERDKPVHLIKVSERWEGKREKERDVNVKLFHPCRGSLTFLAYLQRKVRTTIQMFS